MSDASVMMQETFLLSGRTRCYMHSREEQGITS